LLFSHVFFNVGLYMWSQHSSVSLYLVLIYRSLFGANVLFWFKSKLQYLFIWYKLNIIWNSETLTELCNAIVSELELTKPSVILFKQIDNPLNFTLYNLHIYVNYNYFNLVLFICMYVCMCMHVYMYVCGVHVYVYVCIYVYISCSLY